MSDNVTSIDEATGESQPEEAKKTRAGEKVRVAREKFTEAFDGATRKAKAGAGKASEVARERMGKGYEKVSSDLDQLGQDVNKYVRGNPGKAIAIAAGVGFLVGILLRGRRD